MGRRDLPPGARLLDDSAPTLQVRTHDPDEVLAELARTEVHHVLAGGRPDRRRRLPRAPGSSTRSSPTSPRSCSVRGRAAVADLGIATIADALRLTTTDVTQIGTDVRITAIDEGDHLMFTGIVEELGRVIALETGAESARLTVAGPLVTTDARHGASIAVNGVCLTVVDHEDGRFTVDVMAETLRRSSLGALGPGDPVNLERAMAASDRFGGHIVQGHVDGTGVHPRAGSRVSGGRWSGSACRRALARYVVEKGSIAVDGVSLTVTAVDADSFSVSLIPTTLELTTLGPRASGPRSTSRSTSSRSTSSASSPHRPTSPGSRRAMSRLATIEEALAALRAGRPVLVTDDEDRENEGDVILAGPDRHRGVDGLDDQAQLGLPLRPHAGGGRRPARPPAHGDATTATRGGRHTPSPSTRPRA